MLKTSEAGVERMEVPLKITLAIYCVQQSAVQTAELLSCALGVEPMVVPAAETPSPE